MYVIATVSCPNFHFSVSPHVPFLNLLFEQIANSNEYLVAKIGVDTAENEPLEVWGEIFNIIQSCPYKARLGIFRRIIEEEIKRLQARDSLQRQIDEF